MTSYLTKTITRHRRLFGGAILAGGVVAVAVWSWAVRQAPADPFAAVYSEDELAVQVERGRAVFAAQNCAECHAVSRRVAGLGGDDAELGAGFKGPPLIGIVGRPVTLDDGRAVDRDHRYLRRAIRDSRADIVQGYTFQVMPDYGFLAEADMVALLLYLRALGEDSDAPLPPE